MSSAAERLSSSPEIRLAQHLAYSVDMIGEIAAGFDQAVDREEFGCARSMIDAFYVHIRLLAEFLVRGTKKLDFAL